MTQVAALPYRLRGGGPDILLVTTRETQRWVIPKGNVDGGEDPAEAAAREAYEEAGVEGAVSLAPVGRFRYLKRTDDGRRWQSIRTFALRVEAEHHRWPEEGERARQWVPLVEAPGVVGDAGLARLLKRLAREDWAG